MTILKKIVKFLKERERRIYKCSLCPNCHKLNWKYCFAPFILKGKKGMLEARVCGNCGFKDPKAHFISTDMKLDENTNFENKNN
jgi:transcription elongation factor Elf1